MSSLFRTECGSLSPEKFSPYWHKLLALIGIFQSFILIKNHLLLKNFRLLALKLDCLENECQPLLKLNLNHC